MSFVPPPPPAEPPRIPRPTFRQRTQQWAQRVARLPRPALIGGAVALGLGGLYLTSTLLVDDQVAPGTSVYGVDIGGLSPQAAQERLDTELAAAQAAPIQVRLGDAEEVYEVDPAAAGLSIDLAATVDQAERHGLLGRLFGTDGEELAPVVRLAEDTARAELTALAERSDTTVREGAITFADGVPHPTEPRSGVMLDVAGSFDPLREGFLTDSDGPEPVRLPVREAKPRTDAAEVARAMEEFAEPAMSGPVDLTAGSARISIPPAVIGDHLTLTADDEGTLIPELDGDGLAGDERLAGPIDEATVPPTEASLSLDGDQIAVADGGEAGTRVVTGAIGDAVWPLLTETGAARTAEVETEPIEPELSSDNYRDLGITEVVSSFTVEFPPAPYRITNIGRAAELINGSLVMPDETWSFNDTVGERTEANGFVEGTIILDDRYQTAQGGGVSAVASTMFNAAFFAGVDLVEYGAHSFYIERYPEGREATVAWGSLDLRFLNDSGNALYILASSTDSTVTVTFLGTEKYDEVRSETGPRENITPPSTRRSSDEDCVPQPPLEGFDVAVDRVFVDGGEEIGRETYETSYVPRDEVICTAATD
ncbi:VanW family protein [Streptomyces sp. 6N223]|uniref:VanW family protein n=1 Tax=Streptomyces sp. 6N223 TaxID=3457412 RepID=UPI003FD540EE